jgi:hypothetical protein
LFAGKAWKCWGKRFSLKAIKFIMLKPVLLYLNSPFSQNPCSAHLPSNSASTDETDRDMDRLTEIPSAEKKSSLQPELRRYRRGVDRIGQKKPNLLASSRRIFNVIRRFLSHVS